MKNFFRRDFILKKILFVFISLCLIFTECFAEEIDVFKLAEKGTPEELKNALKHGAKFNVSRDIYDFDNFDDDYWPDYYWPFDTGETPLHRAAACNHNTKSIKFLIEQGLDVNAIASVGLYASLDPLACAIFNKNIVAIKELLKAGANSNSIIEGGLNFVGTSFHIMAFDYDDDNFSLAKDVVNALVKAGGNINSHEELSQEDLKALREGEPDFAKNNTIFLPRNEWKDNEPFFNITGSLSHWAMGNFLATFTPLMWAVIYDKPEIVTILLDFNADVNIKSVENKTAIDYADELPKDSKIKKSAVFKRLKRLKLTQFDDEKFLTQQDKKASCMIRNVD